MSDSLTPRQQELYDYLVSHVRNGHCPSQDVIRKEMRIGVGLLGKCFVALESAGLLRRAGARRKRAMRVLVDGVFLPEPAVIVQRRCACGQPISAKNTCGKCASCRAVDRNTARRGKGLPRGLHAPEDFAEQARHMTRAALARHYGRDTHVIDRWRAETGAVVRKPVIVASQDRGLSDMFRPWRDGSLAGRAADYLRKWGPVFRCDEQGHQTNAGTHWNRGGRTILTDAELIERAERNGFDADAWRRIAA